MRNNYNNNNDMMRMIVVVAVVIIMMMMMISEFLKSQKLYKSVGYKAKHLSSVHV